MIVANLSVLKLYRYLLDLSALWGSIVSYFSEAIYRHTFSEVAWRYLSSRNAGFSQIIQGLFVESIIQRGTRYDKF